MKFSKPYWIGILVVLVAAEVAAFTPKRSSAPVKVGVLHSLTGGCARPMPPLDFINYLKALPK